jgi:hypothetical protein
VQPLPDAGSLPANQPPLSGLPDPQPISRGSMLHGKTRRDRGSALARRTVGSVAAVSGAVVRFEPISRHPSGLGHARPPHSRSVRRPYQASNRSTRSTRGQSVNFATCAKGKCPIHVEEGGSVEIEAGPKTPFSSVSPTRRSHG